ncbi:MAG: tRNA pseudouridine(55) synthase TruB [Treponemataceae bacterium]|nr:tRNA pseudouridine(55) synthase TruB [Treponemataceae bacterium]
MADGIVLFAKNSGQTSFSSLFTIKHGLNTKKVGHTGTLDSFADGLLVVCVGSATHLVKYITELDKEYEAVIEFGSETDTLELTGNVVKTAELPKYGDFIKAVDKWTGENDQIPPSFSAIHVDGKRLSDLARNGKSVEIPSRKINVYKSEILDCRNDRNEKCTGDSDVVKYAHVAFTVSKGTYIRSLARDIANDCTSCAHLAALRRNRVGNFELKNALGYETLPKFCIDGFLNQKLLSPEELKSRERGLEEDVKNYVFELDEKTAVLCGFNILFLKPDFISDFQNGKKLNKSMFENQISEKSFNAVFCQDKFRGLISLENGNLSYCFVRSGI